MILARLEGPAAARVWCDEQRADGRTIGFIATMGALHAGHLALVRRAVAENDVACASVFVNPLQFDDAADLEAYPRDPEGDARLLEEAGCAMEFGGTLATFFPDAEAGAIPAVDPGPLARGLEGAARPGHFEGVATIVSRLFALLRPTRAYFGAKDYQQWLVVRHVAAGLGFPEIVLCPTVRELDGLALSSRNRRLSGAAREQAGALFRGLLAAAAAWEEGERVAAGLRAVLAGALDVPGVEREYVAVRDPLDFGAEDPTGPLTRARALVAARVDGVRLIDNLALGPDEA